MKNFYVLLLFIPIIGFSQNNSFWTKVNASKLERNQRIERTSTPSKFDVYNLQLSNLKQTLSSTVSRSLNVSSDTFVSFPNAKGEMERYEIYEASVMEPEFAAQHPEIQSYVGINIDDPGTTIRFSTTVFGFHAVIYTIGKTYYIDPYTEDLNSYMLYAKENLYSDVDRIGCQLTDELTTRNEIQQNASVSSLRNANDSVFRTFRLALACTQEYSTFHVDAAGQQAASDAVKRATVLAAMNVTMTRVNGLYERDLSATMILVDNINTMSGTSIIFLAENDGYTNNDGFAMLSQNQTIVDTNIGTANYDVGHVFSTGGGGVASLGGICFSNTKARAVTGLPNPTGDPFDVDFVAHEIGHHFGANHTFNGSQANCSGGNRNASTSVEPGSGTTIMAYAGICAGDNIQSNSDDHFNAISIDEMYDRVTGTGQYAGNLTCSVNTGNGNMPPTVEAGNNFTIPYGTAFTLTGTGSDPDGGTVSFCWEQVDIGTVAGQPSPTDTTGPMFRSISPSTSPERTFPRIEDVLADNLTPQWEVIPNVARTMNFALTVRDNQSPNGGQTNRDDMSVTVANTGPFIVTAPNTTNESFPSGSSTTITWDVAGTTANGINTSNVNILLSTDGGTTFTTLVSNTSNDGSENVTFPSVNEPFCRIKIEAVGNIFFAMSKSFSIGATVTVIEDCNTYSSGVANAPIPDNTGGNVALALNVTETTPITDMRVSVDVTHSWTGDLILQIQDPNGNFTNVWNRSCNTARFEDIDATFKENEPAIVCGTPTTGTYAPALGYDDFINANPSGQWVVIAVDQATSDSGTFNEWSLELCTTTTQITLDTDDFELNDFALYPNPNSGDFNLEFNSGSGKDINIDVYDISGKLVYNRSFDPTSRFNEQISLKNVSSGIYIMKVNDSDKTVTRKLIIE
ncbi:MAG: T9SS C-terminal target domain-containing protein [Winogradskyella sp.]|uniref:reprolysin-like metallopeptidase n=1 Tax=Winogradskyella sp. TaxID=1883156 RepID=UPI000F3BC113|nr:zinc-dependent metalloprotease family protein [Winogradskyella sp.]RNC87213.1 MAG: T9SS C-terminal target domain-containing protein [Winogradskyella sp.]